MAEGGTDPLLAVGPHGASPSLFNNAKLLPASAVTIFNAMNRYNEFSVLFNSLFVKEDVLGSRVDPPVLEIWEGPKDRPFLSLLPNILQNVV